MAASMGADAASTKAKARFSSRNLSAVYKAPALRGAALGGSAGYRHGGLTGANRMLVLRGPVRNGALAAAEASAVIAPTPINTPSLRKEHMGQDIHVNLVPAGKGGGWGTEQPGRQETLGHELPSTTPAEPHVVRQYANDSSESCAWTGPRSAATVVASNAAPPRARIVFSNGGPASGRWGDDAVEEDLAQMEVHREEERRREYPDIREQSPEDRRHSIHFDPRAPSRHGTVYCSDIRAPDAGYHRRDSKELYDDQPRFKSRPDAREVCNRGMRHEYEDREPGTLYREHRGFSNQDARYDSPGRIESHRDPRYHLRGDCENEERTLEGGCLRQVHRSDARSPDRQPGPFGNQHVGNVSSGDARPHPVWMHMPANSPPSANLWKMSEAEARNGPSRVGPQAQQSPERYPATNAGGRTGAVRILKRSGPRLLFDHKTGAMVEVDDTKTPSRRSHISSASQADPRTSDIQTDTSSSNTSIVQAIQVQSVSSFRARVEQTLQEYSEDADPPVPSTEPKVDVAGCGGEDEKVVVPCSIAAAQEKQSHSRPRAKEVNTKRVSMGGKMKRLVVAYRPVMKSVVEPAQATNSAAEESTDTSTTMSGSSSRTADPVRPKLKVHEEARSLDTQAELARSQRTRSLKKRNSKANPRARQKTDQTKSNHVKQKPSTGNAETTSTKKVLTSKEAKLKTRPSLVKSKTKASSTNDPTSSSTNEIIIRSEDLLKSQSTVDEDGFQTVKSRRAVLLERKKVREQLAAALSGFHERGDVKRRQNRVNLPDSIVRFGKKGLLVGFKQKVSTSQVESATATTPCAALVLKSTPVAAPVLPMSFIDAIRPVAASAQIATNMDPSARSEDAPRPSGDNEEQKECSTRPKQTRRIGKTKWRLKDKPSHAEYQIEILEVKAAKIEDAQDQLVRERDISGKTQENFVEASTLKHQLVSDKRANRPNTAKKEMKKKYVPKVASDPSSIAHTSVVGIAASVESTPNDSSVYPNSACEPRGVTDFARNGASTSTASLVMQSVKAKMTEHKASIGAVSKACADKLRPSAEKQYAEDADTDKKNSIAAVQKASLKHAMVEEFPPSSAPGIPTNPHSQSSSKPRRAGALSKGDNLIGLKNHALRQKRKSSIQHDSEEKESLAQQPKLVESSSAPTKAPRRASGAKACPTKSMPATHKFAKKMYVVKAPSSAATSSPSAA